MSRFKLYVLYKEIPINPVRLRFNQFVLPTEVVLRSMTPPMPDIARAYNCNLYVPIDASGQPTERNLYTHAEMREKFPGRQPYDTSTPVFMIELYENWGDDGHTDYELSHWTFVMQSEMTTDFYTTRDMWKHPLHMKLNAASAQ